MAVINKKKREEFNTGSRVAGKKKDAALGDMSLRIVLLKAAQTKLDPTVISHNLYMNTIQKYSLFNVYFFSLSHGRESFRIRTDRSASLMLLLCSCERVATILSVETGIKRFLFRRGALTWELVGGEVREGEGGV